MRQFIKNTILALFVVGVAALLLMGPRSGATPTDRTIVTYWEKWTGKEADQMRQIVDSFNDSVGRQKGIYVQYLSMSNIGQKTLVSTAAGVPPDVAGLWESQVVQYAALDALEPLDDLAMSKGIVEGYYKPVYWNACHWDSRLYALISTPMSMGLYYDKQAFIDHGLDPNRPPQTLAQLDEYAKKLDVFRESAGRKHLLCAGYMPLEPGWFVNHTGRWFGISSVDDTTHRPQLNHPKMVEALTWIQSYSRRLGVDMIGEFRSGFGQFNSTQNPFLTGTVAMEQQGPWMANFIEELKPSMNRWKFSKQEEARLPRERRKENYQWGFAAFPAATGAEDVTYCGFDTLVIPRGSRHKREAFEFIAYVNRQDVMERLCSMHCKNSPLAKATAEFFENHPNPYIDVFDRLADSRNAFGVPQTPIWPQINDELTVAVQRISLLKATPQQALDQAQQRVLAFHDRFMEIQSRRRTQ